MKASVFERISIPKPCHEDWNKMTPDEQGAFCSVCNKSVHDFSSKTEAEVEHILMHAEEGKICGRFSTRQIQPVQDLEIPFHLIPQNISPFRAFALAVFLVFGTALFGITDAFGQGMKGKVCIRKEITPPVKQESLALLGDVSYVPVKKKAVEPLPPVKCTMTKGEVKLNQPSVKDTVLLMGNIPGALGDVEKGIIIGKAMLTPATVEPVTQQKEPEANHPLVDSAQSKESEALIPSNREGITLWCYPNPSSGAVSLKYLVRAPSDVSARVYSLEGKFIKQLFQLKNQYAGSYESVVDLSELSNGTYLIGVEVGQEIHSTRLILSR
jgi:hypothetical protein